MKKYYLLLLIIPFFLAACSDNNEVEEIISCGEPIQSSEWDSSHYNVMIAVDNGWGIDLLAPEKMGNISDEEIIIEYKGKEYKKQADSKSDLENTFGLRVVYDESSDRYFLSFGEFDPEQNYKGEPFSIKWEDGTEDMITFNLYLTEEAGKQMLHRELYVNGDLLSDNSLSASITKTEEYPIFDFTCYNICFAVEDAQGNNLLDPQTEGNILDKNIRVTYKDKEFGLIETRFLMPEELGLRVQYYQYYKKNLLTFGEFTPEDCLKGEQFIIHWGDGTEDEIMFDLYITWKKFDPTVHKIVYLNGELYSGESFLIKIVKQ